MLVNFVPKSHFLQNFAVPQNVIPKYAPQKRVKILHNYAVPSSLCCTSPLTTLGCPCASRSRQASKSNRMVSVPLPPPPPPHTDHTGARSLHGYESSGATVTPPTTRGAKGLDPHWDIANRPCMGHETGVGGSAGTKM